MPSDHALAGLRLSGLRRAVACAGATASLVLAALVTAPAANAAEHPQLFSRIGAAPRVPLGSRDLGSLSPSHTMQLGIALRPRSPSALDQFATEVSTPGSAEFDHHITPAEFRKRFGPTAATISAVERSMRAEGFRLGSLSANGLLLHLSAPVSTVEARLGLEIRAYSLLGGSKGWAADAAPLLPRSIARQVASVLGLDQLISVKPLLVNGHAASASARAADAASGPVAPGAASACSAATKGADAFGGWTDDEIARAYGLDGLYRAGDLGKGETIAIFELEPYLRSDIQTFDRCFFGADHTDQISNVTLDGGSGSGAGEGEAVLDIENISALAPDAHMVVYNGPQNNLGNIYASTDEYETIVSQDRANIISTSWGLCESALNSYAPGTLEVESYLFEEAAAQGETVFAAAGDDGSDDCSYNSPTPVAPDLSVDDPASQPFVVGAGGTSLLDDTEPPSETVWNDGVEGGGGGGGISNTWASPAWQADSGVPGVGNSYEASSGYDFCGAPRSGAYVPVCREVPDVTLDADEYRGPSVYMASAGGWTTFGGTSSSAPMWAAITAEITSSSSCAALPDADTSGQRDLGFVSPGLYEVAADPSSYATSFNDITKGNNDIYDLGKGYAATKGYDLASGLGSPIVTGPTGQPGLASSLCKVLGGTSRRSARPVTVTHLAPSHGSASGGTTVTITGTGFSGGSVVVDFGGKPATSATVDSASTITTTAPVESTPPGTIGQPGGPVDVTVTVVGTTTFTSPPGPSAVFNYVPVSAGSSLPTVRGVGPYGGPLSGGNDVIVYGSGFRLAGPISSVTFGGRPATDIHIVNNLLLTAVVPAATGSTVCTTGAGFDTANDCQVEVVVTGAHGSSPPATILPAYTGSAVTGGNGILEPSPGTEVTPGPSEYDYAPAPVIKSISPTPADPSGSTPLTIKGSGFNILTFDWVNFGKAGIYNSEQSVLDSIGPDEITMSPPPGPASAEPTRLAGGVSVQSLGGLSNVERFSYAGRATVAALNPRGGRDTGGEAVVITGSGLDDVTSVLFVGGGYSTVYDITHKSKTSLTFAAPADLPSVDLVEPCTNAGCTAPHGGAARAAATFVVFNVGSPSVSGLSPSSGSSSGGNKVTIYGDNLDGALRVLFGSKSASHIETGSGYPDGNPYAITVRAPAGSVATTVVVKVVTGSGKTKAVSQADYLYT
jgi:hypothetical protein